MAVRPLKGLSILVVDDDALCGFRVRRLLVSAGARVALTDARGGMAYLRAAELAAVAVGTLLRGSEGETFARALDACAAPLVVYGQLSIALPSAGGTVLTGPHDMLVPTLESVGARRRH